MENSQEQSLGGRNGRDDLLVPLLILTFLASAWLVYAFVNRDWLAALGQVAAWIVNPTISYSPLQVGGLPVAFLATIEVLTLGFLASNLLLNKEKDWGIRIIAIVGLGFGLTGLVTIILGILGVFYTLPLNIVLLVLCLVFLVANLYRIWANETLSPRAFFKEHRPFRKLKLPPNKKFWVPACVAIGVIFFFAFYHAIFTVILHWDAVVYHAAMANIIYNYHAIPVIAGTSIGLEMSANFPPLFSSLGSFYYIQIGSIQDVLLRIVAPVMGLLTVLATYKIGEVVAGKKLGVLAALFLALTPLMFGYSIYATSYSTLSFFCTASILFLLLAFTQRDTKYWVGCGLFYGFAALTSYIALYLAPFLIIALIFYLKQEKTSLKLNLNRVFVLVLAVVAVGGVWYIRNYLVVGNPIYPNAYTVLGGINIDPLIEEITFNSIKEGATANFFGGPVSIFDKTMIFLTYRSQFPSVSLLTLLGLVLLPTLHNKKLWLLMLWPLSLSIFILSGISWGFPHHVIVAMPGFALISAIPIIKLLDICKNFDAESSNALLRFKYRFPSIRKSTFIRLSMAVILFIAFIFPSLTLVMGGKVVSDNRNDPVPDDYLWLLEHPNSETWTVLNKLYPQSVAWQFMNTNLSAGEKVATIENNIYYVKNCSNDYFFYLDGWEARDLYNIADPTLMVQFLREQNVTYVIDVGWTRQTGHFELLPMTKYLGSPSPYFPTVFNNASNPAIYNVGPINTPLTNTSKTAVSINTVGWSTLKTVNGVQTQSVIAENDSARIFVATPTLTSITITYLDVGYDKLSINAHNPYSDDWILDYAVINKEDSGKLKSFQFLAPICEEDFLEFGLHAYNENFVISKIDASPYQTTEITSVSSTNSTLSTKITNENLKSIIVELPIINESQRVSLQTNSSGHQVTLELYDGVMQPWEVTNKTSHHLTASSSDSPDNGVVNPTFVWETKKSGYYTLVIVLQDSFAQVVTIDLKIQNVAVIENPAK